MALRTISTTEGDSLHYRPEGSAGEVAERIHTLRTEAREGNSRCCVTGHYTMPNGQTAAAVWIDPQT